MPAGLVAAWSQPIVDGTGRVLGTFAMYYRHAALPGPTHLRLMESAAHMASIAISRHREENALREKDERLAKATVENSHYRERAREAIARAKELEGTLAAAGPDDAAKRGLEEYKTKYNESVGRLKAQTEMNKVSNEKNRDLNDKLRKAVAMIEEYKRRAQAGSAMSTQAGQAVVAAAPRAAPKPAPAGAPPPAPFDVDDDDGVAGGESTLVLENPLMKK